MQQHNTQKEFISPIDTFEKAMNDYRWKDRRITLNFDYRLTVLKERERNSKEIRYFFLLFA